MGAGGRVPRVGAGGGLGEVAGGAGGLAPLGCLNCSGWGLLNSSQSGGRHLTTGAMDFPTRAGHEAERCSSGFKVVRNPVSVVCPRQE